MQLKSVGVTIVYSAVATYLVFKLVAKIKGGARINAKHELEGMDISYHGEAQINIHKDHVEFFMKNN